MLIVASKRLHQKFGPQTEQMTDIREFDVYPKLEPWNLTMKPKSQKK